MLFNNLYNTPDSQRFAAPTRLFHGPGSRGRVHELIPADSPVLLVIDSHFVAHPFAQNLRDQLDIVHEVLVSREPDQASVQSAIAALAGKSWTSLVAMGGGSTIDTAKVLLAHRLFGSYERVGYGALREIPDLLPGDLPVRFLALPTTAGSGSEMSRYYLLIESVTGEKTGGRSWALCPFASILDPQLLVDSPRTLLIQSAFDAFTHLWETLLCRQEASPVVEALAIDGITRLIGALLRLEGLERADEALCQELQLASAFGGIALSNVRTGILHDAGETLVAQCPLPHSLSLYVFFSASLDLYKGCIEEKLSGLRARLSGIAGFNEGSLTHNMEVFWTRQFRDNGLEDTLRRVIAQRVLSGEPLVAKILSDQVLTLKEAPRVLDSASVTAFVERALSRWIP